jgi:beta-1,4-N-acetylglucosaminyltransferase
MKSKRQLKICIACSSGGHYREALTATQFLRANKYLVTFKTPHLDEEVMKNGCYFVTHPGRNICKVLKNAYESFRILIKEKPDLIISTGADVAVPTCLLGKLVGSKLIFIESGGQVYTPSLSGRIVYPFADLFIVQWWPALKNFPKAVYGGPLF